MPEPLHILPNGDAVLLAAVTAVTVNGVRVVIDGSSCHIELDCEHAADARYVRNCIIQAVNEGRKGA